MESLDGICHSICQGLIIKHIKIILEDFVLNAVVPWVIFYEFPHICWVVYFYEYFYFDAILLCTQIYIYLYALVCRPSWFWFQITYICVNQQCLQILNFVQYGIIILCMYFCNLLFHLPLRCICVEVCTSNSSFLLYVF